MNVTEFDQILAGLSDQDFRAKAMGTVLLLPSNLDRMITRLIDGATLVPERLPEMVTFIPITHVLEDEAQEQKLREDIAVELAADVSPDNLVVVGEAVEGHFDKVSIPQRERELLREMARLGYVSRTELKDFLIHRFVQEHGFLLGLYDFQANYPVQRIVATDSECKIMFATVLEDYPNKVDAYTWINIHGFLEVEGRTRYALNAGCKLLNDAKRMTFIQGRGHMEGVKGWCKRRGVIYQERVPGVLQAF